MRYGTDKKDSVQPWETKNTDGIEKRYIRLGNTQMVSEVMRKLSSSAFKTYVYMKLESGGNKEFKFPHTKYSSYMSKPTFFKALKELEDKGFIDVVQHNKNLRISNVYAFSDRWKTL